LSKSPSEPDRPDSEVLAKAERRRFTAEYKMRIPQEAEQFANGKRGCGSREPHPNKSAVEESVEA
jgi:hypothetical protein